MDRPPPPPVPKRTPQLPNPEEMEPQLPLDPEASGPLVVTNEINYRDLTGALEDEVDDIPEFDDEDMPDDVPEFEDDTPRLEQVPELHPFSMNVEQDQSMLDLTPRYGPKEIQSL